MSKYIAIAAMAKNRGIGINGRLPWRIPEELAWFKEKTMGKTLLMGRKTYEGLPKKLQGRNVYVYTRKVGYPNGVNDLSQMPNGEIWICGGAEVYAKFFMLCSEVYLTVVKEEPAEVDTFLPAFEQYFKEPIVLREHPLFTILHFKK